MDSNRSCEAERTEDEALYCATERLAHMTGRSQLFLLALSVFAKVGEAMLICIHVIVLERKKATHSIDGSSIIFQ